MISTSLDWTTTCPSSFVPVKIYFLDYHSSINAKGFQGYTPILRACELNDEILFYFLIDINKLLEKKINFFERTDYGEDIFTICCEKCPDD